MIDRRLLPTALLAMLAFPASADDTPNEDADPEQLRREKEFAETLSNAVLVGRWRLVKDGELGSEREERYTVSSVNKVAGDLWLVNARVQYGEKDVTLPVPVNVRWAGDTPVLSVTDVGLPGLGTYTARVLFYKDLYTGTWFGPGHGGFLSGRVVRTEEGSTKEPSGS